MAKKEKTDSELTINATPKELYENVDFEKRVKLIATDKAVFHKPHSEFEASEVVARIMIAKGEAERA